MRKNNGPPRSIDIAHPPRKAKSVEDELVRLITGARASRTRIVKVIHGRRGNTRTITRNWIFEARRNFKTVIHGEDYDIFNKSVQEMRAECGFFEDSDLGAGNSGITVIWLF